MNTKAARINVRIDTQHMAKLTLDAHRGAVSVSQVVRRILMAYYADARRKL